MKSRLPTMHEDAGYRLEAVQQFMSSGFAAAERGREAPAVSMFANARSEAKFLYRMLEEEAVVVGNGSFVRNLGMLVDNLWIICRTNDLKEILKMQKVTESRLALARLDLGLCEIHGLPRRPLQKAASGRA